MAKSLLEAWSGLVDELFGDERHRLAGTGGRTMTDQECLIVQGESQDQATTQAGGLPRT